MIKINISKEFNEADLSSIQMDSTQDGLVPDKFAVVVKYGIDEKAKERLLNLVNVEDSSHSNLYIFLRELLSEVGRNLENCVSDSFDEAVNNKWYLL